MNQQAKLPPHSIEAEQNVFMTIFAKPETGEMLATEVSAEDFYLPEHKKIFHCIQQLTARGESVDAISVATLYEQRFNDNVMRYLFDMRDNFCSAVNTFAYAQIVREKAQLRRLASASDEIRHIACNPDGRPANDILEHALNLVQESNQHQGQTQVHRVADLMEDYLDELDRRCQLGDAIDGIRTGIDALDARLRGLKPQQLVVLAARPGAGKTALGLNIARHAAVEQKKSVLFFSLEMSEVSLLDRLLAAQGSIPLAAVKQGKVFDHMQLGSSLEAIKQAPLALNESGNINMAAVSAIARKHQFRHGLDLIVIDYLQLLAGDDGKNSLYEKTTKNTRAAKLLAKALHVPVLMLSQLSRENEKRPDKRPIAADLRDSGSIEQDADIILFIYRDDMYHEDSPNQGTAEIIINKGRDIETGTVHAAWKGWCSRFDNLPQGWQPAQREASAFEVKSVGNRYGQKTKAADYAGARG